MRILYTSKCLFYRIFRTMITRNLLRYSFVFFSVVWYVLIYFYLDRSEFIFLTSGLIVLGVSYLYWVVNNSFSGRQIILLAVLYRALLLVGTPNLSDDFYRFFWDGNLINSGINPYEFTPSEYLSLADEENSVEWQQVYPFLNSQEYYSVYPPVNQFFFALASFLAGGNLAYSVFFLKLFIFLFDIALVVLLIQFLKKLLLPVSFAQIYALNPLVIIELTGNIHFEGVMLFFLFAGCYFLEKQKMLLTSFLLALSIGTKLIPLLLLPLLVPFLGKAKSLTLFLATGMFLLLFSYPFASFEVGMNFYQSIDLYFQSFEFNGSMYYMLKELSYLIHGYKSPWVAWILPILVILVILSMVVYLWRTKPYLRNSKFNFLLFSKYSSYCIGVYYLFSTSVHPWYVINLLVWSVFVPIRASIYWSLFVFVSYIAYSSFTVSFAPHGDFNNYWLYYVLIAIQYLVVVIIFTFDFLKKKIRL